MAQLYQRNSEIHRNSRPVRSEVREAVRKGHQLKVLAEETTYSLPFQVRVTNPSNSTESKPKNMFSKRIELIKRFCYGNTKKLKQE